MKPPPHLSAWFRRLPPRLQSAAALFSGQGARAGYLAAVDQGLISVANIAATLILARSAGLAELGVYSVGFTSLRLVRSLQEGLTIQPVNAFGAAMADAEFKPYATSTTLIQVALSICAAVLVAFLGWGLTLLGNDTLGPGVFALWPAVLFWQLQEYMRRLLYTRSRVFGAALNTALANGVRLYLMLWWSARGALDGAAGLSAIALGSLVALLMGVWQTRSYWSRAFSSLLPTFQRNWSFGRYIMGGTIANWLSVECYPLLAAGIISFEAAGAYRALQNLVAPIHMLLRALDTYLTPRAARAYHENGLPALRRLLRLAYLVAGAPILGLLALAVLLPGPILNLLYHDTFPAYQQGIYWMALFYLLWFAYWPLQMIFKAARLSRPIFIANLTAILVMFTLGIWMVFRWDLYGTIAGQALNAAIVTIVLWSAWSKYGIRNTKYD